MKESIIIAIFIIFIYMFLRLNKKSLVLMEASNSGYKFLVHNDKFKKESANILSEIITRMYKLRNHLVNNKGDFPEFKDSISLLEQNLNQERTNIYENSPWMVKNYPLEELFLLPNIIKSLEGHVWSVFYRDVTKQNVELAHKHGIATCVWTVNR